MQLRSSSAKHKLAITALLLALFALPFAMQWNTVLASDNKAVLAGGAVIGTADSSSVPTSAPQTNRVGQISNVSGKSFLGVSAH